MSAKPGVSAHHPGWVKPKGGHWIQSQGWEAAIGFLLLIVGCVLVWDAFDNRGRKLPWPVSGLAPW